MKILGVELVPKDGPPPSELEQRDPTAEWRTIDVSRGPSPTLQDHCYVVGSRDHAQNCVASVLWPNTDIIVRSWASYAEAKHHADRMNRRYDGHREIHREIHRET